LKGAADLPYLTPRFRNSSSRMYCTAFSRFASERPDAGRAVGVEEPAEDVRDVLRRESSVEIPGHSVGGITYRHYAHRAPLAFRAIMTLRQPPAFLPLVKGFDGNARVAEDDPSTPRNGGQCDRSA
jgi:hypothetical protein